MVEELLRNTISDQNSTIVRLQATVQRLKAQLQEGREAATMMEGEYELTLEELKAQLRFNSQAISEVHQEYCLSKAKCTAYHDHIM